MGPYINLGPQARVIMGAGTVIGFADSAVLAWHMVRALRAYDEDAPAGVRRYRVGRSLGRTVYRIVGDEPSNEDQLLGLMDTCEFADLVVNALNQFEA